MLTKFVGTKHGGWNTIFIQHVFSCQQISDVFGLSEQQGALILLAYFYSQKYDGWPNFFKVNSAFIFLLDCE